eukprot:1721038-Pleurochrysis_carterae.AAC.10
MHTRAHTDTQRIRPNNNMRGRMLRAQGDPHMLDKLQLITESEWVEWEAHKQARTPRATPHRFRRL